MVRKSRCKYKDVPGIVREDFNPIALILKIDYIKSNDNWHKLNP
jgi:hypothetical protein